MTRPASPETRQEWTAGQVRALGVKTDLRTAGSIFGYSPTQVYEAAKSDKLPFPVIRCGVRYVVPVQPILDLLGIGSDCPDDQPRGAFMPTPATV
jgi:hypothetical protein